MFAVSLAVLNIEGITGRKRRPVAVLFCVCVWGGGGGGGGGGRGNGRRRLIQSACRWGNSDVPDQPVDLPLVAALCKASFLSTARLSSAV